MALHSPLPSSAVPPQGWQVSFFTGRRVAETAATLFLDMEDPPTIAASELDEAADAWRIDCFFTNRPSAAALAALAALAERLGVDAAAATLAPLADADWVVMSQAGLAPIRAGRFRIRTQDEPESGEAGVIELMIDASRAFGTGHHETTRGCLATLDQMQRQGQRFGRIADIGTGSGVLAFAAWHLWPAARIVASDIDPVAMAVARRFAAANHIRTGRGRGQVELLTSPGARHRRIRSGAPYDLIVANILAGPLIALAPAFAALLRPGGTLILAGLMTGQQRAVLAACRAAGLRRMTVAGEGDWPVLRLARKRSGDRHRKSRAHEPTGTGEW